MVFPNCWDNIAAKNFHRWFILVNGIYGCIFMRTKISNTMDFKLCTNLCRGQHPVSVTDPVSSENKFIEFVFFCSLFWGNKLYILEKRNWRLCQSDGHWRGDCGHGRVTFVEFGLSVDGWSWSRMEGKWAFFIYLINPYKI